MLTKKAKEIQKQHDELFWLEKKISNNVRKLQNDAENELRKFLKSKKKKYKIRFYSLKEEMYSKEWKPVVKIFAVSPITEHSEEWNEFQALLLEASEKIGIEFKFE